MPRYSQFAIWGVPIAVMGVLSITAFAQVAFSEAQFAPQQRKFSASTDYSSVLEKQIRAGETSTAALIVEYHPRIWLRGNWDWDASEEQGSLAWRIVHNPPMTRDDPADDSQQYEFTWVARGADYAYDNPNYTAERWYLRTIAAAEGLAHPEWGFPRALPSTSQNWNREHTKDEYLASARQKLIAGADENIVRGYANMGATGILKPCVGYDWLVTRKYTDGTPVLSAADKEEIQNKIIAVAEDMRAHALGNGFFFNEVDISRYCYFVAGLALYEPSGQGINAENNAKAKQYLDEFDEYWVGKILPALNEQGGTGGWHRGYAYTAGEFYYYGAIVYRIGPFLYAHYTATGQPFENSVYNSGFLKYAIEFQNHMVYPDGEFGVGEDSGNRYQWIAPLSTTSRRRFSMDPELQWLGELSGWVRNALAPSYDLNGGSYDLFDQLMWEEKWPNPRSADALGSGSRHFAKLGWIAMRSGFTSPDDLAALFICQRYHWSEEDLYAQNSFHITRKGWLIEGNRNTLLFDDQYQREITDFPTISDGAEAYAPGSAYDVGPGIQTYESTDRYDYMIGDATRSYDANKLEKFIRSLIWLKEDNTFVVFDRVVTKNAGIKKSWVVNPASTPQVKGERLVKISNGEGALWVKRLLPEDAVEYRNEDKIEVVPSQSALEDYFLFVMQAVDANIAVDSPMLIADDAQVIQQPDNVIIMIGEWQVVITTSGTGEISVVDTSIENEPEGAREYTLFQNYPNPFNASTEIAYTVPDPAHVTLSIYNILGQRIATLVDAKQVGARRIIWNGADEYGYKRGTGIYFCRLKVNNSIVTKKLLMIL